MQFLNYYYIIFAMKLNKQKILKEIDRLGITKYELAKRMTVKHQWVYKVLSDDYEGCTLKTVDRFADALDFDPKDLLK